MAIFMPYVFLVFRNKADLVDITVAGKSNSNVLNDIYLVTNIYLLAIEAT